MKRLTGSPSEIFPSSTSIRIAALVIAFDCDAMRKIASGVMRRPDSLSAQPTARSYTGRPSRSTNTTAPAISFLSTYLCRNWSMRARRLASKPATIRGGAFVLACGCTAQGANANARITEKLVGPLMGDLLCTYRPLREYGHRPTVVGTRTERRPAGLRV